MEKNNYIRGLGKALQERDQAIAGGRLEAEGVHDWENPKVRRANELWIVKSRLAIWDDGQRLKVWRNVIEGRKRLASKLSFWFHFHCNAYMRGRGESICILFRG